AAAGLLLLLGGRVLVLLLVGLVLGADGGAGLRGGRLEQQGGEVHLDLLAAAGAVAVRRGLPGAAGRGERPQVVDDRVLLGGLDLLGLGLRLGRDGGERRGARGGPCTAAGPLHCGRGGLERAVGLRGHHRARRGRLDGRDRGRGEGG